MFEGRDQTIGDVSQTLLELLRKNLSDGSSGIDVDLLSPKSPGGNRLTLFLYKVIENPYLKNQERQVLQTNAAGKLIENQAPLTLDLYYLLTTHSKTADPNLTEAHIALSRAMRVFYDNAILSGSLLRTLSTGTAVRGLTKDSILRITLNPITMEDMTRIWSIFPDTPYQISVAYLVTPVPIESERKFDGAPVVDQIHDQGQREAELQNVGT